MLMGLDSNWVFDLDYLTDSMNYHNDSEENQANLHTGQQESKQDSGTKDKIDSGNSQIEDETNQDCFELPIWHSYSSTNKSFSKSDRPDIMLCKSVLVIGDASERDSLKVLKNKEIEGQNLAEKLQEQEREQFTIDERAKFEDIQALYEKIKRLNENFISTGSAKDERLIKKMNEKRGGLSKSERIKEDTKEEVKDEAQDEEKELDYGILDRQKFTIIDWKTGEMSHTLLMTNEGVSHTYANREEVAFKGGNTVQMLNLRLGKRNWLVHKQMAWCKDFSIRLMVTIYTKIVKDKDVALYAEKDVVFVAEKMLLKFAKKSMFAAKEDRKYKD
ncbi:hypothetical protein Tco_1362944 [Tanacetum coccineum]